MTFEVAHQGDTHAVVDDGVTICWLSDDVEPGLADRIARALNAATARTASCFLHGAYDATLTRCPKCATDALTRRAEKAEAECGRLREQLDALREDEFTMRGRALAAEAKLRRVEARVNDE